MTQAEFAKGWKLLILQTWGWRYRSLTPDGQPTEESKTQMEFYYEKLKWTHGDAWLEVASDFAQGDEWPSLSNLRRSLLLVNRKYMKAITDKSTQELVPMPDEVRQKLVKLGLMQKDFDNIPLHPTVQNLAK